MNLCFLGHQTWLVEYAGVRILIDPILKDSFGVNEQFGIQIYPPREIDVSTLHDIDAIVISHEHSDHFDLQSLNCLPRVPVYIGVLVVSPIEESLKELGFPVIRVSSPSPIDIKGMRLRLYPSHPTTAFWESRVYQVFCEAEGSDTKFLIGVDALISKEFLTALDNGEIVAPNVVAVSNNSQITPAGVTGALQSKSMPENLDKDKYGLVGLDVLQSLMAYLDDLPLPELVLICGGGFMKNYDNFGPFPFSDQDKLGEIIDALSFNQKTIGLLPGEYVDVSSNSFDKGQLSWITPDKGRLATLKDQRDDFIRNGRVVPNKALTGQFKDKSEYETVLFEVEAELKRLAPHIMISSVGYHAFKMKTYRGQRTNDRRLAFVFLGCGNTSKRVYGLNFHTGTFEFDDICDEQILDAYPFGIELFLKDFHSVMIGEIQIWDLAGIAMNGWYECPRFEGIVPFMYSYYGENTSPELLRKVLKRSMSKLVDQ